MTLFDMWHALAVPADAALREYMTARLAPIRTAVCEMVGADAARFSRLGENDERVYEQVVRLMEAYREVVAMIDAAPEAY